MSVPDSAVGAILEIPKDVLNKIKEAERALASLHDASKRTADQVYGDFSKRMPMGVDSFIRKLAEANESMKNMGTVELNIKTQQSQTELDNLSKKTKDTTTEVSEAAQKLSTTPVSLSGIRDEVEATGATFRDVLQHIKNLKKGLLEQPIGTPQASAQQQGVVLWEQYYKSISKVNEETNRHERIVNELKTKIKETEQAINTERDAVDRLRNKLTDAQNAVNAFKNANPDFKIDKAEQQLESLRGKIQRLQEQLDGGGLSEKKENRITREIEQLKQQFNELDNTVVTARRVYSDLATAEDNYLSRISKADVAVGEKTVKLKELNSSLTKAEQSQSAYNKELEKGNTAKSLTAEYVQLTKRIQELNAAMNKFEASGGNINSAAYKALESEMTSAMARRKEIEKADIAEVNQYRQQMATQAYQADLNAFVQHEAQKKAEALKTIQDESDARRNSYRGVIDAFDKMNSGSNRNKDYNDTFENRATLIKQCENAIHSLNRADSDYAQKLERLKGILSELKRRQEELNDKLKEKPKLTIGDAQWLAQQARATKTLEDYTRAYEALKEVMGRTSTSDPAFKKMAGDAQEMKKRIDEIKKSMGGFQNETRKSSDLMGMLGNRIAAAFSVGAVLGFLKKMVDIRAQFELQRVALGAIIQDTDEANKTFTKIQNMALESPFTIMQLERATKQIAAFGFETKKLVPTMKMFADISAGLGVEIDRLVLVMGHLKARNFLEGTMVRQFTNMGFNVLGELAKYYTELEGKMISVGEVQDRVKKKMVSFGDVEEVLKRVTSAGGMFYEMQKKQSDSIWGQLQRITDAYDLMLNEIGQSNEGIIKFVLSTIRQAINSWRTLAPVIKTAAAALGTYFTIATAMKFIPMMINSIRTGFLALKSAQVASKVAQDGLNVSMAANPYGAVIAAVVALGVALYEVITYQDALAESMDRVREEGIGNMYNLIYQYQNLTKTVNDTNSSYEERKKALEELNRVFGDILPKEMLEEEYIRNIKDSYDEATEAIKAYSAEKIKANLKSEIENQVGKEIGEATSDAADWMATLAEIWKDLPEKMPHGTFKTIAKTMMTEISEEVKNGTLPVENAIDELKKRMQDRLGKLMPDGAIDDLFNTNSRSYEALEDWIEKLQEFKDEVDGLDIGFDGMESDELVIVKTRFEELKTAVDDYKKAIESLREAQSNGQISNVKMNEQGDFTADVKGMQGQKALDELNAALVSVQSNVQNFGITWNTTADEVNTAISSNVDQMDYFDLITRQVLLGSLNNFNNWSNRFRNDRSVQTFVQNAQRDTGSVLSAIRTDVSNTMGLIAKKAGVQKSIFDKLKLDGVTSYDDVRKKAKELSDEAAENILKINGIIAALRKLGLTAAQAKAQAESQVGQTLEDAQKEKDVFDQLWRAYGGYEKSKNSKKSKKSSKGQDKELKKWQDIKKAIEEVSTEYDKLRKSYDVETSNERIGELYGKVFDELEVKMSDFYKNGKYDAKELINALEELQGLVKPTTDERKKFRSEVERSIDKTQVEIDLKLAKESEDNLKKQLNDMFANYELSAEFKKAGINVDLIYMLGGKPTTLDDIRAELERLREEGGGDADAENRIKILEDAEKKLTQIELKEQKERLKNYEKYLKQMYSDRAKKMIEAYSMMENMERDFNSFITKLQAEADSSDTTIERKEQIAEQIKSLQFQKAEAIKAVNEELNQNLAKLDWEQFKGSDVFTQLYQDTENLSKKGLDMLIAKLKSAREALQSMDKVDYKAVREITNHIEKLQKVRLDTDSWGELNEVIKETKETIGKVSLEQAQQNMIDAQAKIDAANIEIANLETIIDLKEQDGQETDKIANLSDDLAELYKEDVNTLREKLKEQRNIVKEQQKEVDNNKGISDAYETQRAAINKKISIVNKLQEEFNKVYSSVVDLADALGNDTDIWGDFGQAIADSVFACITLTLQMQLMGIAANSALGIIGWIATALQVVANLLVAIFKAHDKSLQKQIEKIQNEVDALDKAFQKLQKSIERAFSLKNENEFTKQAISNLNRQKQAYYEMIRLEEKKKKKDEDQIKEYYEKIEELDEAMEELYETRREKWGSTNDVWGEANNWVDAWLDAYKEAGDGLDALNQSWDDFYENLVKKQAASAVLGKRMESLINQINDAIDKSLDEYDTIDLYKQIGEEFKKLLGEDNEKLKKIFEYAGIGGNGEYLLSDLQKGIQNITEPQAAAIEALLNSMRFAVFRHTEQLDSLIQLISIQYGNGAENPVVTELKGIRIVLDRIDGRIESVITSNGSRGNVIKVN